MKSLENNNFLTLQSDFKSVYIDKNVSVEKTIQASGLSRRINYGQKIDIDILSSLTLQII